MSQSLTTSVLFDGHLSLEWEEQNLPVSRDRERVEKLLFDKYQKSDSEKSGLWLIILGMADPGVRFNACLEYWKGLAGEWVHQVRSDPESENLREAYSTDIQDLQIESFWNRVPPMTGGEYIDKEYIHATWNVLNSTFQACLRSYKGPVESWFATISPKPETLDRIHFHLVENRRNSERPFAFLATYTSRADTKGRIHHIPLKAALREYENDSKKLLELLAAVKKVAKANRLIGSFEESGELFNPVSLTSQEAFEFLNGVPLFESTGILCRIPRWWKGPKKAQVNLTIGSGAPSKIGFNALLDFDAGMQLDGELLTEEEIRTIRDRSEGLVFIKGKWVAVDKDSLARSLELLQQAKKLSERGQITFAEAMRMLIGLESNGAINIEDAGVTGGEWLRLVLEKMSNPQLVQKTDPSRSLRAVLRPYQQNGLNWLHFLHTLGFGICLADDMGLGKTVQVLAFLQKIKTPGQTSLIVVPASLMENWRSEILKFTPDIKHCVIHPSATSGLSDDIQGSIEKFDIAITTYGMVSRLEWIRQKKWLYVICDEAQAIKNPGTGQTRAVKALKCVNRLAMTGTPVENRLTDLWSLFDFINPGLLGNFKEFRAFTKTLIENPDKFGRLRKAIQPYILRRSKTDKSIITDLPDKIEMKLYCQLSKAQTILYSDLVERLDTDLENNANGIKRKGIILGYLMRFKQLCNHPDQFSGSGFYEEEQSGKFKRLAELCETIRDKREKVLIFTQFAEIIPHLSVFLEKIFRSPGLSLSGATSVKKRKEIVASFQSSRSYLPFFILSLRAGGVGLNLTEANHVVHFDRWWNPAVENQATDRAFRIGQKKNVLVHKFICKGTVEEKIDELIEGKIKLSTEILQSSAENWLTEMNNNDIKELFKLSAL